MVGNAARYESEVAIVKMRVVIEEVVAVEGSMVAKLLPVETTAVMMAT